MDSAIIHVGGRTDVLMQKICGCDKCTSDWTLTDCESSCFRYSFCDNVAIANDILKEEEN